MDVLIVCIVYLYPRCMHGAFGHQEKVSGSLATAVVASYEWNCF